MYSSYRPDVLMISSDVLNIYYSGLKFLFDNGEIICKIILLQQIRRVEMVSVSKQVISSIVGVFLTRELQISIIACCFLFYNLTIFICS